jgi:predicted dehydrogenase
MHLRIEILEAGSIVETRNEDFPKEGAQSYVLQMREFGECVATGSTPETDGAGALRALAVIEAMTRSVETGRTVPIEEILLY